MGSRMTTSTPPIRDRRALRVAGVVLWSAFLGAIALVLGWLTIAQAPANLAQLSKFFFVAWGFALVPAGCAAVLMHGR